MRIVQGAAARSHQSAIEAAYDHFRVDRQGNMVSANTLDHDLDVMRRAMTRMLVAGELSDHPVDDLVGWARIRRSTVTRVLNSRGASLRTLLAVLAVLGLAFEDVVSDATMPPEEASQA